MSRFPHSATLYGRTEAKGYLAISQYLANRSNVTPAEVQIVPEEKRERLRVVGVKAVAHRGEGLTLGTPIPVGSLDGETPEFRKGVLTTWAARGRKDAAQSLAAEFGA